MNIKHYGKKEERGWQKHSQVEAVPKVMSVALIEPFDRWFLSLSKDSGTTRRNDCYTKCGGFDKLNHRNANLLDSSIF